MNTTITSDIGTTIQVATLVNIGVSTGGGVGDVLSSVLASDAGAGSVGYKAFGTNTLLRTVEDKLNETLSSSGVTQDTLGVNELITNAILSGAGEVNFNSVIAVNPATVTEKLTQVPLVGGGGLVNAYRKFVVPNYMAEYKPENTINPERHLRTFNNTSTPHVVIMGDSISTEGVDTYANTTSLWNNIKNKIIDDNPSKTITFTNRAIGGQAWTYADSVPTAFPAWYTNPVTPWLNYIEALNPDCVVLAFGMNDAAFFDATKLVSVVNKIKAWAKVPDIIFVTNPTPAQTTQFPDTLGTGFRGFEGQEGRDYVAEYVRGFAKANGYGFIDINRTLVAIRDSYDVVNGIMQHIGDDAPPTGSFTGTWPANNFTLSGTMSGSVWGEGQTLEIKVGSHASDLIRITKTSGNFIITGSNIGTGVYKTINTLIAVPATDFGYDISVQNNKFTFIIDTTSTILTTNKFVVGSLTVIRHGGIFFPTVKWQGLSTGNLVTLRYSSTYGSPQYKQTATDAEIWGVSDNTASIKPSFGGNGINHFTSKGIALIVKPTVDALDFRVSNFTTTLENKLNGIATGATANSSDATLLNRANHTGTQAQSTITNLTTDLAGKQETLVSGVNIKTINGNSLLGSGDIAISGGGGGVTNLSLSNHTTTTLDILSDTGSDVTIPQATTLLSGLLSSTDKVKLDSIATGATANSSDATLLNRANHTGTQLASTISDFNTAADARVTAGITGKENTITSGTTSQYWRGDKTFQTLDKTAVGLSNVDNTSDATKNAASATLTNKTISGLSNTLSNIAQSSVTNLTTDLASKQPLSTVLTNTTASFTTALETKLNGIAAGAEVNVNADWNSVSGDSQILNKPTLGTASSLNVAATGNAAVGEVVKGNDTRLTDARTPTAHTHTLGDIVSVPTASLIGRSSVGTGVAESISLGANLNLSAGVLSATGGGTVRNQSTGIYTGGYLSIGTPNTTFSISDGTGIVVDNTLGTPTATEVSWTGKTNITALHVGAGITSYVAIDASGNVVQQATPFTNTQHRDYIIIGSLVHTNLTNLDAVNQFGEMVVSPANQLSDLTEAIGIFNISGNVFSPNGSNLQLNKSAGKIYSQGSNWAINAKDPNVVTLGSLTGLTFQYRFQTGTNGATGTNINPDIYDVGGVSTAVPVNKFTVQRIFSFVSNNVKIQAGQTLYNSLSEAIAAIQTQSFVTESSIAANGILRGFLVVKQGTTNLSSTASAFFLEAPKFGGVAGVGGLSVSSLQNVYDNSTTPEILTDSSRGAVDFRRGSGADTDNVITVQNNAGTTKFSVTGNGAVSGTTFNGVGLTTSGSSSDFLNATGNYTTLPTIPSLLALNSTLYYWRF